MDHFNLQQPQDFEEAGGSYLEDGEHFVKITGCTTGFSDVKRTPFYEVEFTDGSGAAITERFHITEKSKMIFGGFLVKCGLDTPEKRRGFTPAKIINKAVVVVLVENVWNDAKMRDYKQVTKYRAATPEERKSGVVTEPQLTPTQKKNGNGKRVSSAQHDNSDGYDNGDSYAGGADGEGSVDDLPF